jgi:hypothetical protein
LLGKFSSFPPFFPNFPPFYKKHQLDYITQLVFYKIIVATNHETTIVAPATSNASGGPGGAHCFVIVASSFS